MAEEKLFKFTRAESAYFGQLGEIAAKAESQLRWVANEANTVVAEAKARLGLAPEAPLAADPKRGAFVLVPAAPAEPAEPIEGERVPEPIDLALERAKALPPEPTVAT